jgi:hypothetical protein
MSWFRGSKEWMEGLMALVQKGKQRGLNKVCTDICMLRKHAMGGWKDKTVYTPARGR